MRIVLASTSERRKDLLSSLNIPFEVKSLNVIENLDEKKNHYIECMNTAKKKAMAVFEQEKGNVIVIGSDTIVSFNNKIYGKPKDYNDAYKMLKEFSNNTHKVITSLCLLIRKDGKEYEELTYDEGLVTIDYMTDEEINNWIESNNVYNKAGAYAIQEGFAKFVKRIEGDFYSIVGLPVHKLYYLLKKYQ